MRNKVLSVAAVAAIALMSSNADAAANLTSVSITGLASPYVWNTANNGNFTVFLQQPIGKILNPNSEAISDPTTAGLNSFTINGEGSPPNTLAEAASVYFITLNFADGASIARNYFSTTDILGTGTTDTVNGTVYELTGFSWNRTTADNVSATVAASGGDKSDYAGQFSFTATDGAVPEPTTWSMMLAGFGMVGAGLRSRRKVSTTVTYA